MDERARGGGGCGRGAGNSRGWENGAGNNRNHGKGVKRDCNDTITIFQVNDLTTVDNKVPSHLHILGIGLQVNFSNDRNKTKS